jgi:hypothetical protein
MCGASGERPSRRVVSGGQTDQVVSGNTRSLFREAAIQLV